jgi:N-glycosylase/DNA lyase
MRIKEEKNRIIIKEQPDFEPCHIFECGQAFRWEKEKDNSYTVVANGKVINVFKQNEDIIINNTSAEDFNDIWKSYFDLNTDYTNIKLWLNNDEIMKKAIAFGQGIRILDQDEFEMIISFIISANNRIPMIKKVIENLSISFGDKIGEYNGKLYYSFPTHEQLANADLELIKSCKAGFRSERIKEAAMRIAGERDVVYKLKNKSYDEALEYLLTYKGIGNKVANCILLFSMKQFSTFPVDVWVRRVMQELYVPKTTNDKQIREFAESKFGNMSGYAQQYLFYYARENGIGK